MTLASLLTTTSPVAWSPKPRDDELDLFGLTHPGKVRSENQDHFLLCTVHPQVVMHGTSLPDPDRLPLRGERLATILLVADGVGGGKGGGAASQLATETITNYVASSLRCYHSAGSTDREEFAEALRAAALEAHTAVKTEASEKGVAKMATTLTLAIAVWPWMHVVQVGDSRCYHYSDGKLKQVTRDQTMAQDLVDRGVLKPERVSQSPFSHVLASAIGADEATPVVTRFNLGRPGSVTLMCSDGLTKHVADEQIATEIGRMESSEQLCRRLLDLALDGGGSDNVTVLAARVQRKA